MTDFGASPGLDSLMPDRLDSEYCRREAKRMRAKAESETSPVLKAEFAKVANHFELLADEIDAVKRLTGSVKARNSGD